MGELYIRQDRDGPRNAAVQVTGSGLHDWTRVVDLHHMTPSPNEVKLDAVYYAVSSKIEVQLGWEWGDSTIPFLPIGGRGRIDFAEVSGVHSVTKSPGAHIALRVLPLAHTNEVEWSDQAFTLTLDLSKHVGTQDG